MPLVTAADMPLVTVEPIACLLACLIACLFASVGSIVSTRLLVEHQDISLLAPSIDNMLPNKDLDGVSIGPLGWNYRAGVCRCVCVCVCVGDPWHIVSRTVVFWFDSIHVTTYRTHLIGPRHGCSPTNYEL